MLEKFSQRLGCRRLDSLDVRGNTRNQLARWVEVEEMEWLEEDSLEQIVPEITDDGLPKIGRDINRSEFRNSFDCRHDNQKHQEDPSI